MNQRNVDELAALIAVAPVHGTIRDVANFLASSGVLVPSVLTDEECRRVDTGVNEEDEYDARAAALFRADLERIAKGEP